MIRATYLFILLLFSLCYGLRAEETEPVCDESDSLTIEQLEIKCQDALREENYYCARAFAEQAKRSRAFNTSPLNSKMNIYICYGVATLYAGDINFSVNDIFRCQEILQTSPDSIKPRNKERFHTLMGEYYMETKEYALAVKEYASAFEIYRPLFSSLKTARDRSSALLRMGAAKTNMGYALSNGWPNVPDSLLRSQLCHQEAKQFLQMAREFVKEVTSSQSRDTLDYMILRIESYQEYHLAHYFYVIGKYSMQKNKPWSPERDSAILKIQNAIRISTVRGWRRLLSFCYILKGDILLDLDNDETFEQDRLLGIEAYKQAYLVIKYSKQKFTPNANIIFKLIEKFKKRKIPIDVDLLVQAQNIIFSSAKSELNLALRYKKLFEDFNEKNDSLSAQIDLLKTTKTRVKEQIITLYIIAFVMLTVFVLVHILFWKRLKTALLKASISELNSKAAEERSQELAAQKRENAHRTKNDLQNIASKIKTRLRNKKLDDNTLVKTYLEETRDDIQVALVLYKMLETQTNSGDFLSLGDFLTELTSLLWQDSFGYPKSGCEVVLNLEDLPPLRAAVVKEIGKVITELFHNVRKYAYSEEEPKWIKLHMELQDTDEGQQLYFSVTDRGKGLSNAEDRNFGSQLFDLIIQKKFKGKILPIETGQGGQGVCFSFTIPINNLKM